ncbi:MAG: sulfotransferase [Mariprofundaceae bacterium]
MAIRKRLSNNQKRKIRQLVDQATHAYNSGRPEICTQLCKQLLTIDENNADAVNFQACMSLASDGIEAAMPLCLRAAELAPKRIEFQLNLGRIYLSQGQYDVALSHYKRALEINSKESLALLGVCKTLVEMGCLEEAKMYFERVRRAKIDHVDGFFCLAGICRGFGEYDEARQVLHALSKRYPDNASAHFELAVMALEEGDKEQALIAVRKALSLDARHAKALDLLANLSEFTSRESPDIAMILDALEHSPEASEDREILHTAMGSVEVKLGERDAAFAHFTKANEIRAQQSSYDADGELAHLQAITSFYNQDVLRQHSDVSDERPVFIIGMPRCGSTLVEQILAAHPDVSGRGEVNMFEPALAEVLSSKETLRLENMSAITPAQWGEVASNYKARLLRTGSDNRRITDKTLSNVRLIGAIYCAFPNARIVHVRRHPLDNCLSMYITNILGGAYDYRLRLGSLGYYYRMYQRLMQHWRDILPAGVMYEMDYEALVSNQEEETRKLLAACGLDWDEACLDFQKASHRVQTASILQVRGRLNAASVGRWKQYERHLQPLIRILGTD